MELLRVNKDSNSEYEFVFLVIKDNKQLEFTVEELFQAHKLIDSQLTKLVAYERAKLKKTIEDLETRTQYFKGKLQEIDALEASIL